jgi:hypothetical protein
MNKIFTPRVLLITVLVAFAAISRFLPHPPNFTPIAAMALFGGSLMNKKYLGFLIPLAAMLVSDFFIGFHDTLWSVYLSFALIAGIGILMSNKVKVMNVVAASLASSILFFGLTNFAVYFTYPSFYNNITECYVAAIPFFHNGLLGDLFYSGVMFGGFYLVQLKFPKLAELKK